VAHEQQGAGTKVGSWQDEMSRHGLNFLCMSISTSAVL